MSMTCTFAREQLALYVNGDATAEERASTQEHLSECGQCQEIVTQYQMTAAAVAGTVGDARPRPLRSRRPAARRWRAAAVAAVVTMGLLLTLQVPAVASAVGKVLPWITVFELDKNGVADFIKRYQDDTITQVFYPDRYETVEEAEEAWGRRIPLPTGLPEGMVLNRVEVMHWKSGHKDGTFAYWNQKVGGNLIVEVSTRPHQRKVPRGASSKVTVNGEEAVVIRGTFGQYPGQSLKWEPDSEIQVLFPLGDLYYEVSTMGESPDLTVDDLISIAESIRP
jgi:hypothetical protein